MKPAAITKKWKSKKKLKMPKTVTVIGAGLAGSEAAWQLASRGIPVTLIEMKPGTKSPAPHGKRTRE